jgi:hypothetical protein
MDDAELRALVDGGFQSLREEMAEFRDEIRGEIGDIKTTLEIHGQRLMALQQGDAAIQKQLTEQSRIRDERSRARFPHTGYPPNPPWLERPQG